MTWSSDWLSVPAEGPAKAAAWQPEFADPPEPPPTVEDEAVQHEHEREVERAAAYQRGYHEGAAQAREQEARTLSGALAALGNATRTIMERQAVPEELLREHVLTLALAVAHHVIAREVRGDKHAVADLVRRALTQFPLDEAVRIRLNPGDLSVISTVNSADGGSIRIAPGREVEWVPDTELANGECIVEGRRRIVDGRIDRVLMRIHNELSNA